MMMAITSSLLHILGIFYMDGIKVCYNGLIEFIEYVKPCYNYNDWMQLVQYMWGMQRYRVAANYIYLRVNDKNKVASIFINEIPKA